MVVPPLPGVDVVERDARLSDVDQRESLVPDRLSHKLAEVLVLAAEAAPDKGRSGKKRQGEWRDRRSNDAFRVHFPLSALEARW
jgi:hypothetical protein